MVKKLLALCLCLALILPVLPVSASADTETPEELCKRITAIHQQCLAATGRESLGGYCGLMTSWQLYFMGVNIRPFVNDGNRQYDYYENMEMTTGGHRVKTYSAKEYSLSQALKEATDYGNWDVYNILVGFQWTNTEAGAIYGHAVVIYAIIDGMVYFTEGFSTSLGTHEGQPIVISIDDFVRYYHDWTIFEGIVVFGQKDYANECRNYSCCLYGEAQEDIPIYSQPCEPEDKEADTLLMGTIKAGERLLLTGLYENWLGDFYYLIENNGEDAFIRADNIKALAFSTEDISLSNIQMPEALSDSQAFALKGNVVSQYETLDKLILEIVDQNGKSVYSETVVGVEGQFDLERTDLIKQKFDAQHNGAYRLEIYGDVVQHYMQKGEMRSGTKQVHLATFDSQQPVDPNAVLAVAAAPVEPEDGWNYINNTWYYYENGKPYSGWLCYKGMDYFLQEDGSVTTGVAEINGRNRYFTETGVMRTGWIKTEEGIRYLLSNGVAAVGWRKIDGLAYNFTQEGLLETECWLEDEGDRYYVLNDGSRATGWLTVDKQRYCFGSNGKLLAQLVEEKGKEAYILPVATAGELTASKTVSALG